MSSSINSLKLAHARDTAWLIALYLAIHDGDPPPNEEVVGHDRQQGAALLAIEALSEALDEKARDAVRHALAPIQKQSPMKVVDSKVAGERLEAMGIHITEYSGEHEQAANVAESIRRHPYCFRFGVLTYCVFPPSLILHT